MIPLDGKVGGGGGLAEARRADSKAVGALALRPHARAHESNDKPDGDKSWGRGDAEWACDAKFGNCTDFHSYFMGLARAKGHAGALRDGLPIPGGDEKEAKVGGYHCWAYVWLESQGWMPVDISEADKQPREDRLLLRRRSTPTA